MEAGKIVDIIADKVDLRSLAGTLTIIFFTLSGWNIFQILRKIGKAEIKHNDGWIDFRYEIKWKSLSDLFSFINKRENPWNRCSTSNI